MAGSGRILSDDDYPRPFDQLNLGIERADHAVLDHAEYRDRTTGLRQKVLHGPRSRPHREVRRREVWLGGDEFIQPLTLNARDLSVN